jgi:hypothetical protein
LASGGRTAIGKFNARDSSAMFAMASIEAAVCSMSTRAKSNPAAFSNVRIAGLRTRLTHVPICSSPRSSAARSGLACISLPSQLKRESLA